jgi:hypothetical protein
VSFGSDIGNEIGRQVFGCLCMVFIVGMIGGITVWKLAAWMLTHISIHLK